MKGGVTSPWSGRLYMSWCLTTSMVCGLPFKSQQTCQTNEQLVVVSPELYLLERLPLELVHRWSFSSVCTVKRVLQYVTNVHEGKDVSCFRVDYKHKLAILVVVAAMMTTTVSPLSLLLLLAVAVRTACAQVLHVATLQTCTALDNCKSCTIDAACGWCTTAVQCVSGNATGPTTKSCGTGA